MSKKDYKKIAEDLAIYWKKRKDNCDTEAELEKAEREFKSLLNDLCKTFRYDNKQFDEARFLKAVEF